VCVCAGRYGSGWALVAGFGSFASASAFARRAAARAGCEVTLRCGVGGAHGEWSVSCPVTWRSSHGPACACRLLAVSGGVRGLNEMLFHAGLPREFPRPAKAV
jgi:hypothetical protein